MSRPAIHSQTLGVVNTAKYLGVTLDTKLTFNNHINSICSKANHTRAFLQHNTSHCPRHVKEACYNTLVRPLVEYASVVWDPHTKCRIQQLEMVQRQAA